MTARLIPSDLAGIQYGEQADFATATTTLTLMRGARNIKFTPGLSMHEPGYQKTSDMRGPDASVVGGKGGTLAFEVPLSSGVAASEAPVMALMKNCGMTQISVAAAVDKIDGGTTTTFTIPSGDLGNVAVGCGLMIVQAAGDPSLRFVTRVADATTTTVTFNCDTEPATAIAANDDLTAVDTLIPKSGEPAAYLTFRVYQGQGATDRLLWTLSGCAGKFSIPAVEADALPVVQFEFLVDTWADSEASIAQTDVTGVVPQPVLGDKFFVDGTATLTRSIGFDPGMALSPIMATSGTNGRSGWFYSASEPVLEILPLSDTAWTTKMETPTTFEAMFASYKSTTDAWGIFVPRVQVVSDDKADSDGLLRETMTLKAVDPGATADDDLTPRFAICITK